MPNTATLEAPPRESRLVAQRRVKRWKRILQARKAGELRASCKTDEPRDSIPTIVEAPSDSPVATLDSPDIPINEPSVATLESLESPGPETVDLPEDLPEPSKPSPSTKPLTVGRGIYGITAGFASRWLDSSKNNPLPYDPAANINRESEELPAIVTQALGVRRPSDRTPSKAVSVNLIRNYILYRIDPRTDRRTTKQRASDLGISTTAIAKLDHIPGVYEEVRKARFELCKQGLLLVDEAMFRKASQGDTPSAKLMYERWDPSYLPKTGTMNVNTDLASLQGKSTDELIAMTEKLTEELKSIKSTVASYNAQPTSQPSPEPTSGTGDS